MWAAAFFLLMLQTPDYDAEGAKALDEGKYQTAADLFRKAIAADAQDYYAHFNLAMALTLLNKDAEGIAEYRTTLELKPNLYEAELNCAILLLRQKNPADALVLLEDAVTQKPTEYAPRFYLAEALVQTAQWEKAFDSYKQAAGLDTKAAAAELGMGRALAMQGKLDEAAPHFREAIRRDPQYKDALLSLAALYEESKRVAEAAAIYAEFPENAAAQQRRTSLLLSNQKYAEAKAQLEEIYQKSPTPANRKALASVYLQNQDLDKALPLLQTAVAEEPSNYELRMGYAHALRDRRNFPAAALQFQEAAKLKPTEAKTWAELGGMLFLTKDYERALAALAQARQLGDTNPGNWFVTGVMLDSTRQLKPALEAYQKFLSMSEGKSPDQEFQARQRSRLIQRELERR